MDCCQKIHVDEGLALTLPQSILASGFLCEYRLMYAKRFKPVKSEQIWTVAFRNNKNDAYHQGNVPSCSEDKVGPQGALGIWQRGRPAEIL
ncbi:AFA-III adhesin operon regulatory protein [Trichinella spiralis]|uniref:AFA-III adhesin operon regulatory protein n=1 Tax=Trichinella spiralis TaxID=6334 RepID=A0ABR3KE05_TRISP